ncbi:MAG: hypothetical protein ACE5GR_01720 [Nitrosopumilus sp.]
MKNYFKTKSKSENFSKLRKRRGITDIIGTMMLMAVTVTGASALTYFVNDTFVTGNLATASTLDSSIQSIQLLAYDTRDSTFLLTMSNLDNQLDGKLCGTTCSGTNQLPINGGSEFIIMKIKNNGLNSIFLEDVKLNNIEHKWDSTTSGILLNTSIPDLNDANGRNYPSDGKFSILPDTVNPIQNNSIEIPSGETVNLLVKLGSNDPDVLLSKGIRVFLNIGDIAPVEFLIETGDVR